MSFKLVALIPAGGVGERAQHTVQGQAVPKQYRQINQASMLMHSVRALLADPRVEHVYIGVAATDDWIEREDFSALAGRVTILPCGGETRALTVLNTLRESGLDEDAWVLVHDAARPGLPQEALSELITVCLQQQQGGLLALPVGDTVKRARVLQNTPVCVQETVSREGLWLAQTPQLFKAHELREALAQALAQGAEITDEASAMEFIGQHPLLVKGHWRNLKVTWLSDFDLVEQFL
ncbi:MAG: 2-C-methyl-D-erythritol 4-phosphate cytidylyltransferase [Pelistega sp.]|nr:2-C-methyl-D-erythritol 4-phosphate cytidylyltransferase [Pelistega sp.]